MKTVITDRLLKEVKYQTARSGGKGGQNVNKVSTKVELYFDVKNSAGLTNDEKEKFYRRLKNKISEQGVLKISAQSGRTQFTNKLAVITKFEKLVVKALTNPKRRIATQLPAEENEKRLLQKRLKAEKKDRRKLNDNS